MFRLLSEGEHLVLSLTNGGKKIANALDLFSFVSPAFTEIAEDWEFPVDIQEVLVYELIDDTTFKKMFVAFGEEMLPQLQFAQCQVVAFVRNFQGWLAKRGFGTHFLIRVGDEFQVVELCFGDGERLGVYLHTLDDCRRAGNVGHRIVTPSIVGLNLEK